MIGFFLSALRHMFEDSRIVRARGERVIAFRPELEILEDRRLLAEMVWAWNGGPDQNWSNPNNWMGNVVPGPNDTAIFSAPFNNLDGSTVDAAFGGTIAGLILNLQWDKTLELRRDLTVTGATQHKNGRVLGVAGDFYVASGGTYDWEGGRIDGTASHVIEANATMNIIGTKTLESGHNILNSGTVKWIGSGGADQELKMPYGATIENRSGSRFYVQYATQAGGPNVMTINGASPPGTPSGRFLVRSGATVTNTVRRTAVSAIYDNSGTVEIAAFQGTGVFALRWNTTNSGTYSIGTGCELALESQTPGAVHSFAGATATGQGRILHNTPETVMFVTETVTVGNMLQAGDPHTVLSGSGTLVVTGTFDLFDGDWSGTDGVTKIAANAKLNIKQGHFTMFPISGRKIDNYGTVTWEGVRDISMTAGASFHNRAGAVFEIKTGQKMEGAGSGGFINDGLFKKTAGGITTIWVPFWFSDGRIEQPANVAKPRIMNPQDAKRGAIILDGDGMDIVGNFMQDGGTTHVGPFATLLVQGDYTQTAGANDAGGTASLIHVTGNFLHKGGSTRLSGQALLDVDGLFSITNETGQSTVTLDGGRIESAVNLALNALLIGTGSITGNFTNSGITKVGDVNAQRVGDLSVIGSYTQASSGVLDIDIRNSTPGTFDRLLVSQHVTFGGTLNVTLLDGFMPLPGMQFSVVTFASYDGAFQFIYAPPLGFGRWEARYNNPLGSFTLGVIY